MKRSLASLANFATLAAPLLVGLAATYLSATAYAAEPAASAAKSTYLKERADCDAGRTAEDRATCLKEAGAAAQERKRNALDTNGTAYRQNAIERCNTVAPKDKADCLARIEGPMQKNQQTTTSGSVAGGGIIRETTTTTTGQPTVIIIPSAIPPASAPR